MDVDRTKVSRIWWRHIPHRRQVWYRPEHPADGRWQRGSVVEALYFADSPETAWAEWYRFLSEFSLRPEKSLPRDLWRWKISLPNVADLSTDEKLARIGLAPLVPSRSSWNPYQLIGEALIEDGWPALLAPSAARTQGLVVCVFRKTEKVEGLKPVPPPQIRRRPPAPPRGMRT